MLPRRALSRTHPSLPGTAGGARHDLQCVPRGLGASADQRSSAALSRARPGFHCAGGDSPAFASRPPPALYFSAAPLRPAALGVAEAVPGSPAAAASASSAPTSSKRARRHSAGSLSARAL